MKALVTGGAGFIGSHLVAALLQQGHEVTCFDNFSTGRKAYLKPFEKNKSFKLVKADLLNLAAVKKAVKGQDLVWHLAANADVRGGFTRTHVDLEQNVLATWNVLEAMRLAGVKKLAFASTSAVYGEARQLPIPESYAPVFPWSVYGASKVGAEAFVSAYANLFGLQAWLFRFANIVGKNSTHGVIPDFLAKLHKNPRELEILGDGHQSKPFLHVSDCVNAMLYIARHEKAPISVYNLGSMDWLVIKKLAEIVCEEMKLENVKLRYTGGRSGWPGDVPKYMLDISALRKLGFTPKYNSEQAVRLAVKENLSG
ncbi:MAG: SDR family NAD(P)-dependent oxidoreductase [Candidatus Diapherotrites archaeon]|uniref:SDR family NAD(P)-dependent oxidoreductase n=1 Tax=Candidatus Iainarchaeum sp. TaxID=3101447 RepID=A0A8T4LA68_9ARCH|nr:SDR family NAD(P)-dependent oxidoreductase [Candidatus Diapherotrites archaeon]